MLAFTLLLNDLADDPWGSTPVPTPQLQRLLIVFTRELFVYACRFMYPSAAGFYRLFQRARMSQLKSGGPCLPVVYASCHISRFVRGESGFALFGDGAAVAGFGLRR